MSSSSSSKALEEGERCLDRPYKSKKKSHKPPQIGGRGGGGCGRGRSNKIEIKLQVSMWLVVYVIVKVAPLVLNQVGQPSLAPLYLYPEKGSAHIPIAPSLVPSLVPSPTSSGRSKRAGREWEGNEGHDPRSICFKFHAYAHAQPNHARGYKQEVAVGTLAFFLDIIATAIVGVGLRVRQWLW